MTHRPYDKNTVIEPQPSCMSRLYESSGRIMTIQTHFNHDFQSCSNHLGMIITLSWFVKLQTIYDKQWGSGSLRGGLCVMDPWDTMKYASRLVNGTGNIPTSWDSWKALRKQGAFPRFLNGDPGTAGDGPRRVHVYWKNTRIRSQSIRKMW